MVFSIYGCLSLIDSSVGKLRFIHDQCNNGSSTMSEKELPVIYTLHETADNNKNIHHMTKQKKMVGSLSWVKQLPPKVKRKFE